MRLRTPRGDATRFAMQVTTTDPATGIAVPMDLTDLNIAIVFTAKRRLADPDLEKVFQRTRALGGIVVTEPTQGRIEVRLAPSDTSALAAPSALYWDIQLTAAGEPITMDTGILFIEPDVTQA